MNRNIEEHPKWYHDIPIIKTLVLGSFPPHEDNWDVEFYYPNSQNRFWRILADIAKVELKYFKGKLPEAVTERVEIMKSLSVGVQNMGLKIERDGKSALDTKIKIIEYQNILEIIEKHPELNQILLPGYSAKNSTARTFVKYLNENGIAIQNDFEFKTGQCFKINVFNREIECFILYSTSTVSRKKYEVVFGEFEKHLKKNL